MISETYTFYWLGGSRDVFEGPTPEDALNRNGVGAGAIRALDFYAQGDNREYEWRDGRWEKVESA